MKNTEEIDKLLESPDHKDTKKAWELFENQGWDLNSIVSYIIEHHSTTKYDDTIKHFIKSKIFFVGPLKFEFFLDIDCESLEIEEHYCLMFQLSLIDENKQTVKTLKREEIFHKTYIMLFRDDSWNEKIPALERSISLTIQQVIAPLCLEKTKGLYDYLEKVMIRKD
mgnify:CR=1 FL=1